MQSSITSPLGTSLFFATIRPGPTIVIVGGHHGDEPAGFAAAGLLAGYANTDHGSMIIIPQANPLACTMFSRYGGEGESDLNRCYDLREDDHDAKCDGAQHAAELVRVITALAPAEQPLVVIDLHETRAGHSVIPAGRSMWCYGANLTAVELAAGTGLHAMPLMEPDHTHTFVAAMGRRGATAIAVETVKSGQLGARIEQQIAAVLAIAASIGVEIEVDIPSVLNRIGEPEAE